MTVVTPAGEPLLNQEQRAGFAKLMADVEAMDADPDFAQSMLSAVGYKIEDQFPAGRAKTALRKLAK